MESFYGGRAGFPFMIVKSYPYIDGRKHYIAKEKVRVQQEDGSYIDKELYILQNGNFIERVDSFDDEGEKLLTNAAQFSIWELTTYNKHPVEAVEYEKLTIHSHDNINPLEKDEGGFCSTQSCYVQEIETPEDVCDEDGKNFTLSYEFNQRGATTSIVNYGEYVIIDSPLKQDPDNGKVFRRGLEGKIYIGQIVGPTGPAPELHLDTYDNITEKYSNFYHSIGSFNIENKDLVAGTGEGDNTYYVLTEDERTYLVDNAGNKYEVTGNTINVNGEDINVNTLPTKSLVEAQERGNSIRYATALIKNGEHVTGCVLGFKIPYSVNRFTAFVASPYKTIANTEGKHIPLDELDDLISLDGEKIQPFFNKWNIKIPRGFDGNSIRVSGNAQDGITFTETNYREHEEGDISGVRNFTVRQNDTNRYLEVIVKDIQNNEETSQQITPPINYIKYASL